MYSELATIFYPSPSCTRPRKQKVNAIVIHHAAGQGSVEAVGALFADPRRQASANYGVDSEGRIACYVEEEDRAYTTGAAIDHRAITLEVSNCGGAPDWPVSDAALEATIELCADICRRHGFRLSYTGDKSGNLLMHKWYAATACPGPYLAGKFPYIVQEVNKRLGKTAAADTTPKKAEGIVLQQLKKGSTGEAVKVLQWLLIGRGYSCGYYGADGDFGISTEAAVKGFQKAKGLAVDGIVGVLTWGRLLGVKA